MGQTKNKQNSHFKNNSAKKPTNQLDFIQPLSLRASKKQTELLVWVQAFINQHGYGPSYREIMRGLSYTSVSTVAAHISHLVAGGYLIKKGRSARSLHILKPIKNVEELCLSGQTATPGLEPSGLIKAHQKWLVGEASVLLEKAEASLEEDDIFKAKVLIEALKILGLDAAALSLNTQLKEIEERLG